MAAKPRKGDALLFFSLKPNGDFDENALHTGCPVLRWGEGGAGRSCRCTSCCAGAGS